MPSSKERDKRTGRLAFAKKAKAIGLPLQQAASAIRTDDVFAGTEPLVKTTGSKQRCVHCSLTIYPGQTYRTTPWSINRKYVHEDCYEQQQRGQ